MIALDPIPRPIDHVHLDGAHDAPALVTKAETLSYDALELAVGRLAAALHGHVRKPGARVATWLPKTVEACLMPLAAPRAGLVHVPVNPVLKRAQVAHILADSGASLLLTSAGRAATLRAGDVPPGCMVWLEDDATTVRGAGTPLPVSTVDPDKLAAIMYTSGSYRATEGVMLSHANLWLGAVSVAHYLKLAPDDRTLAVLPLGFDYGQNQLFSTWKASGVVHPFDFLMAKDVWRAVEREGITTLAAVPPLWLQLVEAEAPPARRLRRITNSGGALTPALIDRLRPRVPNADLYPMYGLTEAFRSTYLPPELVAAHPSSMGRAIPFAEVVAVAKDGSEARDGGEPGELVHAGPLVAQGYWRDAERTAARFRPAPNWTQSSGTAVWSGDTVTRDADGLFYFVGRDDEMIKSSGHRISPLEIEEARLASGAVAEAVAHGVKDATLGQTIRLVVRGSGEEAVLRSTEARAALAHAARVVEWRDELPRNANGKLDRSAIAREVVKPHGAIPLRWDAARMARALDASDGRTPCFVYDLEIARAKVATLRHALPEGVAIHYAVKANPHPDVIAALAAQVDGLDIASGGELATVLAAAPDAHVSFAGPGKRNAEIEAAIGAGVTLNLGSVGEARRAFAIADRLGVSPKLAVRVNPDFALKGSGMKMGGGAAPFGVDAQHAAVLVRELRAAGADWRGFHIFGSQALDSDAIAATQAATVALAARLADEVDACPPLVNLGGGFGIPYFAGDASVDVAVIGARLGEVLAARPSGLADSRFALELGRWLVGECGIYLTRVVDRKESRGETFLIVDGGLHHQLAASGNFGTVVRRNYPIAVAARLDDEATETVNVHGCLCTPLDRLGDAVVLPRSDVGDVIALFMAGAYGATASPAAFLGQGPAREIVL